MRKKLVLHDLSAADEGRFLPVASEEYILFSAAPSVQSGGSQRVAQGRPQKRAHC
jgi:hypothetical protein